MGDVLRVSAANGLCVDALSNVGGVHGVWSQISIFVLLVEDQVAVHLQDKRTFRWSSRSSDCSNGIRDKGRSRLVWSPEVKLTSANTNPVSKGWKTLPLLMAAMEAGPQRKYPVKKSPCLTSAPVLILIQDSGRQPTVAGLLRCGVHHLPSF